MVAIAGHLVAQRGVRIALGAKCLLNRMILDSMAMEATEVYRSNQHH
jgi:hypothetical protein